MPSGKRLSGKSALDRSRSDGFHMQKRFIWLSMAAGLLMALTSLLGLADPNTYERETPNWAAQAVGQDFINLAVAFPVLLISSILVLRRDSFRAFLVWAGVLIYVVYSFILYSFFVHFGPLFLLYTATLGLSFYSFLGGIVTLDWQAAKRSLAAVRTGPASILLATVAVLFSLLWLVDIIGALKRGGIPQDLEKVGLWVNPIHVLDLSLLLPGAFIVAVLLLRKSTLGLVLAVPYLVFFALMGIAIISMAINTQTAGPQMAVMSAIVIASALISAGYLKRIS